MLKNVMGKTNSPIVYKDTVLNETHITFLEKFFISSVEVSGKLSDGTPFHPKKAKQSALMQSHAKPKGNQEREESAPKDSLEAVYLQAVRNYTNMFQRWQQNMEIDMPAIRTYMLPLFERVKEFGLSLFTLHYYASKESYIFHHSVSVGILTAYVARQLGYAKGEVIQAGLAGLLSDCGMARITPDILAKSGPLNPEEKKEIKQHPVLSYRLVEHIPTISQEAKRGILQHHERQNGTGYPFGLKNNDLAEYAPIIAVCDTYHYLTCEQTKKPGHSPFEAIAEIQKKQYSAFDPAVTRVFLKMFINTTNGANVQLSTNETAEIVFVNESEPMRPVVQIEGSRKVISLKDDASLFITDLLNV